MSGNGVAGVIVGLLRITTKLALPDDLYLSTLIYFVITGVILGLCIVSYFMLLKLPIGKYYMKEVAMRKEERKEEEKRVLGVGEEGKGNYYMNVAKKIWVEMVEVFLIFFVSLSLFPGMTLQIETTSGLSEDWFGVLMTFTFQVFDFLGRTLPRWLILFNVKTLWIPVGLRVVFFPLFILSINPLVFDSDAFYFIFMMAFALSNGYCATLAMMYGPTRVKDGEKEVAGIMMSFVLNFGILVAVHFAYLLLYLVKGQSPI